MAPALDHFRDPRGLGLVALCAAFLALVVGFHAAWLVLAARGAWEARWCAYAVLLALFHFSEFLVTAQNQPRDVTADAFLLNHSRAYGAAFAAAVAEFWVELALAPALKRGGASLVMGAALCMGGQALRTVAMLTAARSFTHLVQVERRAGHELVTSGVYARLRHPAYVGWFAWSVGTQVLLANPLCALAYAAAAWRFFAERIPVEEDALIDFFGGAYVTYARSAWGFPGVRSPADECTVERAEERRRAADERTAGARAAEGERAAAGAPQG
jgi:protein-S-isoprenylcysteine O-methyltransferase